MHSPFSGMDLFLEAHALWLDVHAEKLSPRFVVAIEQYLIMAEDDRSLAMRTIIPDLVMINPARLGVTAPLDVNYTAPTLIEPLTNQ